MTRQKPFEPARVARIKRKYHTKDPLPLSPWRRHVKHLAKWVLVCIAALIAATLVTVLKHA